DLCEVRVETTMAEMLGGPPPKARKPVATFQDRRCGKASQRATHLLRCRCRSGLWRRAERLLGRRRKRSFMRASRCIFLVYVVTRIVSGCSDISIMSRLGC